MVKHVWSLEDIDDCVIVTRVVDTGEETEDQQPILKLRRISRPNAFAGINEIRSSLDMLEKELKNDENNDKKIVEKLKK